MKNRLSRLIQLLDWCPRDGAVDVDHLSKQLGTTPATLRRDLRDLRDAGAFEARAEASNEGVLASELLSNTPANDVHLAPQREELIAMHVGARFLATEVESHPELGAVVERAASIVEQHASADLRLELAAIDERYRFGPREQERKFHRVIAQAIAERRVLTFEYRGEGELEWRTREVEPFVQFFIHERWSFLAFCRQAGDLRQFRLDRCKDLKVTDQSFSPRAVEAPTRKSSGRNSR